jgi:aspartyl-tRNA(Asn)/glutamyl-tRNA(Gln) amidotransferase subunit C
MALTHQDIERLAQLARLHMTEDEQNRAEHELEAILGYVERLQKIDTSSLVLTSSAVSLDEWRLDQAEGCDLAIHQGVLSNFPDREGNLLRVPPVFEQPKA